MLAIKSFASMARSYRRITQMVNIKEGLNK